MNNKNTEKVDGCLRASKTTISFYGSEISKKKIQELVFVYEGFFEYG